MKWIQELSLKTKEKEKIQKLVNGNSIIDIKFVQNNIYLFLKNSNIIRLKNSTEIIYKKLKKAIEKIDFKESKFQKINKKADEWTTDEIEKLKCNFYKKSLEELSSELNKSQYQISLKVTKLGIVSSKKWNENEIKYLKENLNVSNYELARTLKRSISSIKAKKRILKLKKSENEIIYQKFI